MSRALESFNGHLKYLTPSLTAPLRFSSHNHDERDSEHCGGDQRAKRVDRAKRKASEVSQWSDSEGGNSVACLIEGDYFTGHHGRKSWKRLPAQTDTQREESRTAKARKAKSSDGTGFTGGAGDHLERCDQYKTGKPM